MRVAFIGGTGFIGPRAVRHAIAAGHDVCVLHRGTHPNETKASSIRVDRSDPTALARAIAQANPEVVVDTRAMTRLDAETTRSSWEGPLVVLSSQDVYAQFGRLLGHPAPEPEAVITEASPLTVPFPYRHIDGAHSDPEYDKKEVEAVFAGRECTVLRLPAVYGYEDPRRRFGAIIDALDRGDALPHVDGARWRWTRAHVDDVGYAIALALENVDGFRIFNVGDDAPTMRTWCERFAVEVNVELRWEGRTPPEELQHLGAMDADVVVSSAAIREALGWQEVSTLDQRVGDIVSWARTSR